jgi:hypothetical protein
MISHMIPTLGLLFYSIKSVLADTPCPFFADIFLFIHHRLPNQHHKAPGILQQHKPVRGI